MLSHGSAEETPSQQASASALDLDALKKSLPQESRCDPPSPYPPFEPRCSYCYLQITKILKCGACKKRPYCSKQCQKTDWKQHKIWCGQTCELGVDIEIRCSSEEKGMGIFALRNIQLGEKILAERCVIKVTEERSILDVYGQFASSPSSVQAAVLALNAAADFPDMLLLAVIGSHKARASEVLRRWKGNSFGIEPGSGLCVTASRFNHSCIPNCGRYFIHDHDLMVISAGKDLCIGEELTISYTVKYYDEGFARFQLHLNEAWGFTCTCPACVDPPLFEKVMQLEIMDDQINVLGSSGREKQAYKVGERILKLQDELGAVPSRKHRTYYDMFQMAVLQRRTLGKARMCAQKNLENWELAIGGSNKEPAEITNARMLLEHPESHRNYLAFEGTPYAWK